MQLTSIGRAIWQGASQGTRLAEAGAGDPDVQERLRKSKKRAAPVTKLVKALRESKRSWDEVQELLGISRATYYRWERALREKGLAGLKPKSRRPKRTRGKVHWKPELMVRVEVLRKENPLGGDGPSGRFSGRRVFLWGNGRWAGF